MVNLAIVFFLIVLAVSVTLLNSGGLYAILYSNRERRLSSLLICSLLGTHIVQGMIVIPLYTAKRWRIENKTANIIVSDCFLFSYLLTNYMSCITVLLISIDRFLAIRFPLSYRVRATKSCAFRSIAASLLYVFILCVIPFRNHKVGGRKYLPSRTWTFLMLICNTVVPFLIIIAVYAYISRKSFLFIKKCYHRRLMQTRRENMPKKSIRTFLTKEFATAKIAVIIAISYIICWGPSCMYYLLQSLCAKNCFPPSFDGTVTEQNLSYAMKFLTMIDGLVAPIIYCLRDKLIVSSFMRKFGRKEGQFLSFASASHHYKEVGVVATKPSQKLRVPAQDTESLSTVGSGSEPIAATKGQSSNFLQVQVIGAYPMRPLITGPDERDSGATSDDSRPVLLKEIRPDSKSTFCKDDGECVMHSVPSIPESFLDSSVPRGLDSVHSSGTNTAGSGDVGCVLDSSKDETHKNGILAVDITDASDCEEALLPRTE